MRVENISAKPEKRRYVGVVIMVLGMVAIPASLYVAWPALMHIGQQLV